MDLVSLQRRIAVALGEKPADLLLTDCHIVNVFTRGSKRATSPSWTA